MIRKILKWIFTPCKVEKKINDHRDHITKMNPENINRMF